MPMNEASLAQMNKSWNSVAGSYARVVRALHQRGIAIYGTFVLGYDADTPETIERTLDFALESRLEIANFNPLTPMPGSALYARLLGEGRLLSPQWWLDPDYRYGDAVFEPRGMRPHELADGVFEARRRFYRWSAIGRRLQLPQPRQTIRRPARATQGRRQTRMAHWRLDGQKGQMLRQI